MEKVKLIVLGTGRATKRFIQKNINSPIIAIVGVVLDDSIGLEDRMEFVNDLHRTVDERIAILPFASESFAKGEIVFSSEYRRIIPKEYIDKHLMVNCHGGILPKWRGFAANAWAIMNGEKEIGYSIHRITDELDGGEVYFVKHIPISEEQTYSDVHHLMTGSISEDVPQVLYEIVRNGLKGEIQSNRGVAYCTKFSPGMGELRNFDLESAYYVNLYRCMAKPLGTGLFFYYKGERYGVDKVEHGKKHGSIDYCCTVGKIVNVDENGVWIKTKDNVIVLSEISRDNCLIEKERLFKVFRNGTMIGS